MFNHVLNNREGKKVAVIVNDMSSINIDTALVEKGGAAQSIRAAFSAIKKLFCS